MEVLNDRNANYGRYCSKHAREKVARLEAEERRAKEERA